jgi:hypothetical protein
MARSYSNYLPVAPADIRRKHRGVQAPHKRPGSAGTMSDSAAKTEIVRPARRLAAAFSLAFALLLLGLAGSASAHHRSTQQALIAGGIRVPSLTHGQMEVIATNKAAILGLAERQAHADDVLKRLLNFVNIQFSFCLWGLVPGSLVDDASPFNECGHAYLAATRSLLGHMQLTADSPAVDALTAKIDREMLQNNASLTLCRYSDESFSTAQVIYPHWSDIPLSANAADVLQFGADGREHRGGVHAVWAKTSGHADGAPRRQPVTRSAPRGANKDSGLLHKSSPDMPDIRSRSEAALHYN